MNDDEIGNVVVSLAAFAALIALSLHLGLGWWTIAVALVYCGLRTEA